MAIDNHLAPAADRVAAEQSHIADERRAYEQFRSTVKAVPAEPADVNSAAQPGAAGAVQAVSGRGSRPTARCQQVRDAFAETVRPYSTEDIDHEEPVIETVRAELGDSLAAALSPETTQEFTPQLKAAVVSNVDARRDELAVMERALSREADSLREATSTYDDITDRLWELNETSLLEFGFSELRQRHEMLAEDRTACERRLEARQELLSSTTSRGGDTGMGHRTLAEYLYQSQPFSYPVVSTLAQLDSVLADCQRTLRNHLVRRV